ncbi:MAG: histidine phosphatase family protein [Dichotomicrobium sp.]
MLLPDGVTIYFVRHGQTSWNAERRFQGQLDIPLNDTGRAQAARNGAALARAIDNVAGIDFVSSPLSRATETMEILRRALALPPKSYRTDPRLQELNVGAHQGRLTREILGEDPRTSEVEGGDRWHFVHPGDGGESYAMLSARVVDWLVSVKRDTVVTAHGGVMRCLRHQVERLDTSEVFRMHVPQDKVLVIRGGGTGWI